MRSFSALDLTTGQPFCAGVLLADGNRLVTTLRTDWGPAEERRPGVFHVGGVGGGQEPGEALDGCALREAREELGCEVELVPSPITFWYEAGNSRWEQVACTDPIPPLACGRKYIDADRPFKPGLPAGPYLYLGTYLGRLQGRLRPGRSEIKALLLLTLDQVRHLAGGDQVPLAGLVYGGARLFSAEPLPAGALVCNPPWEGTLRSLLHLLDDLGVDPAVLGFARASGARAGGGG